MSNFPIATSNLLDFLPHRPPMVWIDQVLWVDDGELCGECGVELKDDGRYFNEEGILRQSSFLEWMAQAYGYVCAVKLIGSGEARKNAFMAAVRNLEFLEDSSSIKSGTQLKVRVELIRELGPMSLVSAKVTSQDGEVTFAKAQLKLFAN